MLNECLLEKSDPGVVIERRALNRAEEVAAVRALTERRKADGVEIGRRLIRWKAELPREQYRAMLAEAGLSLPSGEGYIMQARIADGTLAPAKSRKSAATMRVDEAIAYLHKHGEHSAAALLAEVANGQD